MKRLPIALALVSILLAGCRAEVRLLLEVTETGEGSLAAEVGINEQLSDLINQLFGDESDQIVSELDLGLEGTSTTRTESDMTVYVTEVSFSTVEEIPTAAAGNFTSFSLELTDEGTALEATLDVAGELDLSEFPVDPNAIDPEALQAQIVVKLPGEPVDHNADEALPDGRLTWDIPLDRELYMFANTQYPQAGFPWWLLGLLAVTGGAALAVWWAAVRRDRTAAAARRPAPEPPPPPPSPEDAGRGSPFFDFEEG